MANQVKNPDFCQTPLKNAVLDQDLPSNPVTGQMFFDPIAKALKIWDGTTWISYGSLLDAHPVGSVYISGSPTSPATLFGGTWIPLEGRFLIGADGTYAEDSTGGAASVALSQSNLPAVTYEVIANGTMGGTNKRIYGDYGGGAGPIYTSHLIQEGPYAIAVNPATVGPLGSGTEHNNMPPYRAKYMWERTA